MSFASTDELNTYLGRTVSDVTKAQQALDIATQQIQDYTDQTLSEVAGDEETLDGTGRGKLFLAEFPVTAIDSVVEDGTALTEGNEDDFVWYSNGTLVRIGGNWVSKRQAVVVTYTHGYATIPDSIKNITLAVASRILDAPPAVTQLSSSESLSTTYGPSKAQYLSPLEQASLDRFRAPLVA